MRTVVPLLVAIAAVVGGLLTDRARSGAGAERRVLDPARRRRLHRFIGVAWVGLLALGLVLLWMGWWAWGLAPSGTTPEASASVAFSAAALELFFWGLLTPRALRRDRPPLTP